MAQGAVVGGCRGSDQWRELIDRAVAVEREIESPPPLGTLPTVERALIYQALGDAPDSARAYANEVRELALQRGDDWAHAAILAPLCELECQEGDLEKAEQLLEEGRERMRRAEAWYLVPSYAFSAALIDAFAGRVDAARAQAEEGRAGSRELFPIR